MEFETVTESPEETGKLGEVIGSCLAPGDVLLLVGILGSGKTCLTQGIARGMGIDEPIASPTFVILLEHRARLPLYHVDLYRLERTDEVLDLGLDDYFYGDGVTVVEWADRAPAAMPPERLEVSMSYVDERRRRIVLHPKGDRYQELVRRIAEERANVR